MKQSFTLNQCLRLLYQETSADESYMLKELIRQNSTLRKEFNRMQETCQSLCDIVFSPKKESVESILKHNQDMELATRWAQRYTNLVCVIALEQPL